eukprot:TRINITY_DN3519_c0_g1_i3.p1 TRINITY_DN3519_c0_g1~~TRINITY_DN3519_c0_g1_i3.p1  ORF type:complete len:452 (+),score=158.85 TRINITY_DN3519_c0_g1_i3:1372-2727(+)
MLAFLDEHRSPKGIDSSDPRVKERRRLQLEGNAKIVERQRPVLPEGHACALWSFQVPWEPFEYHLNNPCAETKPFLWSNAFHVANSEWMMFFGIEPMEAENRSSLWVGICNNLANSITAYTKIEVLVPGQGVCGSVELLGEAVDTLHPCGQVFQKNKFGRFWWHKSPADLQRNLFRGTGDSDNQRSFELLLTIKLNVMNSTERSPAPEEDPRLWETSMKYLKPWVEGRVAAAKVPLEERIKALEREVIQEKENGVLMVRAKEAELEHLVQKEKEAQQREQAALAKVSQLEGKLHDAQMREDKLKQKIAHQEQYIKDQQKREQKLRDAITSLEDKLKHAAAREDQLKKWGAQLQGALNEAKAREEALIADKTRLEEYIKNTAIREERLQNGIRDLEGKLKEGRLMEDHLKTNVHRLQQNVCTCVWSCPAGVGVQRERRDAPWEQRKALPGNY